MGSLSIWHWIIVIIAAAIYGVPVSKILARAGRSPWWTIAFMIPLLNLVAIWVFAYSRWPALNEK
ncbi:hypothetical protein CWO89_29240 [Bradyrhizobium sp. Leo170]|nr:hypothetical protein CWO89_29240 [Bradyrhizobium sp. Leo170]